MNMHKISATVLAAAILVTPAFAATPKATQNLNPNDHTQGIVVEDGLAEGSHTITVPLTITVEPDGSISGASIDEPDGGYDGIKVDLTLPPVVPAPRQQ
jgi:hypothetical protein